MLFYYLSSHEDTQLLDKYYYHKIKKKELKTKREYFDCVTDTKWILIKPSSLLRIEPVTAEEKQSLESVSAKT